MNYEEMTIKAIENEFFKEGGLRDKLRKDITNIIDARIGRWFIGGGGFLIITAVLAWANLTSKVNSNTEKIENAVTNEGAALIIQRLDQIESTVKDKNDTIKALDDRLRAKGI